MPSPTSSASCATSCGTLARERIAPRAAEIDESHEFPWDVVELFRENDIFGLFFDEEHGGLGTGTLLALVAIEEVSKVCATSGADPRGAGARLARAQARRQRGAEGALPAAARVGRVAAAYALTEAGSGSDSAAMRTTARRDGDEYVLNGTKRFITNAGVASLYTVFAKTDPEAGHCGHLGLPRRVGRARLRGRAARAEDGDLRLDDRRARPSTTAASPPRTCSARRARASRSRCGSSTARGRASRRRRSGSRRARPTTRSSTRRRARRWASRSRSTS